MSRFDVTHLSPIAFGKDGLFGGGERYPYDLARAMAQLVPTQLLTFTKQGGIRQEKGLKITELPLRYRFKSAEVNSLSERMITSLLSSKTVHAHQWETVTTNLAVLAGRAVGRRVFATDHGGSGRNYWRKLRLQRPLTGFLTQSAFAASFYPEMTTKTTVIAGGVDTARFRPGTSDRNRRALFVGRLLPHKGIDVLLEALPADVPLHVMGRPYKPEYHERLRRLADGKDVTFIEDASDAEIAEAYRTARVLVLPSLHHPTEGPPSPRAELLGLTLLEAMASGTPVICTRTGGMPEIVIDGVTGHIVEPHDKPALAQRLQDLVHGDEAPWQQMSSAAVDLVNERYTWDAVARHCLEIYENPPRA